MANPSITKEPVSSQQSLNPGPLILRGVLSVIFGILAFAWPGPSLIAIALLYGAYAFADGVVAITTGMRRGRHGQSWGLPIIEGIIGMAVGIITFLRPGITLLALAVLVGVWAIITGVLEIMAAFKLEAFGPRLQASRGGRFALGLAGLISVLLGISIFMMPALGAITLLMMVASYSLIFGILMIGLGAHLRAEQRKISEKTTVSKAA